MLDHGGWSQAQAAESYASGDEQAAAYLAAASLLADISYDDA